MKSHRLLGLRCRHVESGFTGKLRSVAKAAGQIVSVTITADDGTTQSFPAWEAEMVERPQRVNRTRQKMAEVRARQNAKERER